MLLEVLVPLHVRPELSLGFGLRTQGAPLPEGELSEVAHPLVQSKPLELEAPKPRGVALINRRSPITRPIARREIKRQSVHAILTLGGI